MWSEKHLALSVDEFYNDLLRHVLLVSDREAMVTFEPSLNDN